MAVSKLPRGKSFRRRYSEHVRIEAKFAYEDGESLGQIAKRMGIPMNTIKSWRYQSKKSSFMQTWDRRNGEARRHAKAIDHLPQLEKHVKGASDETKAAAAMLAKVPANERYLLQHAIVDLTKANPKYFVKQDEQVKAVEQSEVVFHVKDQPDSVKALAWRLIQLSPDHLEAIRDVAIALMGGIKTTNRPQNTEPQINPNYQHHPGSTPARRAQHQARTNDMIQQMREQNAAQMKAQSPPVDRRRVRRLHDR